MPYLPDVPPKYNYCKKHGVEYPRYPGSFCPECVHEAESQNKLPNNPHIPPKPQNESPTENLPIPKPPNKISTEEWQKMQAMFGTLKDKYQESPLEPHVVPEDKHAPFPIKYTPPLPFTPLAKKHDKDDNTEKTLWFCVLLGIIIVALIIYGGLHG